MARSNLPVSYRAYAVGAKQGRTDARIVRSLAGTPGYVGTRRSYMAAKIRGVRWDARNSRTSIRMEARGYVGGYWSESKHPRDSRGRFA